MKLTWIMVLVTFMVHTKKARKTRDESDSETESDEWNERLAESVAKGSAAAKGKAPATASTKAQPAAGDTGMSPIPRERGKKTPARKNANRKGIEIQEPSEQRFVTSERIKEFDNKECIGERHVDVRALKERSQEFGFLLEKAGLEPICRFPETTGFCLDLVRKFYQNATGLIDDEDGVKQFVTIVRNKRLVITPDLVGKAIGMEAITSGVHYLKGHVYNNTTWRTVVDAICLPDTLSTGNSVYSKELRLEYKLLHYVVCYNILPNMNTKMLRWDRMLFLYLIGNPAASMGTNYNIPFLIWSRMTKYLDSTRSSERLHFPMIIMRMFRLLHINTEATFYMHSLGTINDSTFVKSVPTRQDDTPTPRQRRPAPASSTAATTSTSASVSEEASITTVYREQRRVANELARISGRLDTLEKKQSLLTKMVQKILQHLGCGSVEGSD